MRILVELRGNVMLTSVVMLMRSQLCQKINKTWVIVISNSSYVVMSQLVKVVAGVEDGAITAVLCFLKTGIMVLGL